MFIVDLKYCRFKKRIGLKNVKIDDYQKKSNQVFIVLQKKRLSDAKFFYLCVLNACFNKQGRYKTKFYNFVEILRDKTMDDKLLNKITPSLNYNYSLKSFDIQNQPIKI